MPELNKEDDNSAAVSNRFMRWNLHWLLSLAWVAVMTAIASCRGLWSLAPNEIGDFFAGIAAPVAFLWLILGYWLQRDELRMNRKELRAQNEETSRLADAASQQVFLAKQELVLKQIESKLDAIQDAVEVLADTLHRFEKLAPGEGPNLSPIPFLDRTLEYKSRDGLKSLAGRLAHFMEVWDQNYAENYGTISACMSARQPPVYGDLIRQYHDLQPNWEQCKGMAQAFQLSTVEDYAQETGIDKLLQCVQSILTITGSASVSLGSFMVQAQGRVGSVAVETGSDETG